jgi:hypothetical protein
MKITTPYGVARVIGPGLLLDGRPGLYVQYLRADLSDAGRERWPAGGPCVYDVVEQDNNEPVTA